MNAYRQHFEPAQEPNRYSFNKKTLQALCRVLTLYPYVTATGSASNVAGRVACVLNRIPKRLVVLEHLRDRHVELELVYAAADKHLAPSAQDICEMCALIVRELPAWFQTVGAVVLFE